MKHSTLKAQLTRATKVQDKDARQWQVLTACQNAVRCWNQVGNYWPDDWSRWQRALDDAYLNQGGFARAPRLEDIV